MALICWPALLVFAMGSQIVVLLTRRNIYSLKPALVLANPTIDQTKGSIRIPSE